MSAIFLELARTVLFLSSSLHTFRLRKISSMVVLAPHREAAKTLSLLRLATYMLIVSVDAGAGVELLATTLAGNHMATVLTGYAFAKTQKLCHRHYWGEPSFSLLCFVPLY